MTASREPLNIFVTGASGYIGASVLDRLLLHPNASTFEITILLRSREKGDKLLGVLKDTAIPKVNIEIGSNADLDKLRKLTSQADVVFSIADCDDLPAPSRFSVVPRIGLNRREKSQFLFIHQEQGFSLTTRKAVEPLRLFGSTPTRKRSRLSQTINPTER
jgi:uncharacterized protein YbjT (DUF2867 family)